MHTEVVATPEGEIIGRLRNVVATIASTLRPVAMVAAPVMIATLLETGMRLPGAIPGPSALLLPRGCLLAGPLGLLLLAGLLNWLGGTLLRLAGLLSWLGGALLLLRFRLGLGTLLLLGLGGALLLLRFRLGLGTLLLLWLGGALLLLRFWLGLGTLLLLRFRLRLGMLLLCGFRRGLLLSGLRLCRFGLRFLLLFVLRIGRDNRPEKHKNGSGTNNSRDLHGHYLR